MLIAISRVGETHANLCTRTRWIQDMAIWQLNGIVITHPLPAGFFMAAPVGIQRVF